MKSKCVESVNQWILFEWKKKTLMVNEWIFLWMMLWWKYLMRGHFFFSKQQQTENRVGGGKIEKWIKLKWWILSLPKLGVFDASFFDFMGQFFFISFHLFFFVSNVKCEQWTESCLMLAIQNKPWWVGTTKFFDGTHTIQT